MPVYFQAGNPHIKSSVTTHNCIKPPLPPFINAGKMPSSPQAKAKTLIDINESHNISLFTNSKHELISSYAVHVSESAEKTFKLFSKSSSPPCKSLNKASSKRSFPGAFTNGQACFSNKKRLVSAMPPTSHSITMSAAQDKFITDAMNEIRQNELNLAAKRRKLMAGAFSSVGTTGYGGDHGADNLNYFGCKFHKSYKDIPVENDSTQQNIRKSSQVNILDEINFHSDVAQIVATSGGLVMYWNKAFSAMTEKSESFLRKSIRPITIFELIQPWSLPSLYGMLALALHDLSIVGVESIHSDKRKKGNRREDSSGSSTTETTTPEGETKSSSHLSITLPCKPFHQSAPNHTISIIFMEDLVPSKRCFLGIITPSTRHQDLIYPSPKDLYAPATGATESSEECVQRPTKEDDPSLVTITKGHEDRNATTHRCCNQTDSDSRSCPILPCGKIVRVDDELLCRLLCAERLQN